LSWPPLLLLAAVPVAGAAGALERPTAFAGVPPSSTDTAAESELLHATAPPQRADAFAAGAPAFTLGLDAALRPWPLRDGALEANGAETAPLRAGAVVGLGDVRAVAAAMIQETPATPASEPAKSDGSLGRWMKRHWWVPALIGAAVVATAGESLWDDDDEDDDD
jgi:hypothetical protein